MIENPNISREFDGSEQYLPDNIDELLTAKLKRLLIIWTGIVLVMTVLFLLF